MAKQIISAMSPIRFVLERRGGAAIWSRVTIWKDDKRFDVIEFDDNLDDVESISHNLPPGNYGCVFKLVVNKDLNGKFGYRHSVGDHEVFEDEGVVDTAGNIPDGGGFRDEYILAVQP